MSLNRRELLKGAALSAVGVAIGAGTSGTIAPSASAGTTPRWPGHKPGRIYLGVSTIGSLDDTLRLTGPVGLQRTFSSWSSGAGEDRTIRADHAAGRLPWISFKPPFETSGGWSAVASGKYDADIRARARRYAALSKPVIVTFNHEPHNDSTGTPAQFAAAWIRIYDVMTRETGRKNVVSAPIIGEWTFNPVNRNGHPEAYITSGVLDRCDFLGVDLYQNQSGDGYAERLGRVLDWLDARGHSQKMVGLGETGATNAFGSPSAAAWWAQSWAWAAAHTSRVGAISYFNSRRNNRNGHNWLLTETSSKLSAFRSSLSSGVACRLT